MGAIQGGIDPITNTGTPLAIRYQSVMWGVETYREWLISSLIEYGIDTPIDGGQEIKLFHPESYNLVSMAMQYGHIVPDRTSDKFVFSSTARDFLRDK